MGCLHLITAADVESENFSKRSLICEKWSEEKLFLLGLSKFTCGDVNIS